MRLRDDEIRFYVEFKRPSEREKDPKEYKKFMIKRWQDALVIFDYGDVLKALEIAQREGIANKYDFVHLKQVGLNKAKANRVGSDVNMVCAMYDIVIDEWSIGYNRQGQRYKNDDGLIPAEIWNRIPEEINPDAYQFGRGCAEVHCLRQTYKKRADFETNKHIGGVVDAGLTNCVFMAYSPKERRGRPPCTGCKRWLGYFRAKE